VSNKKQRDAAAGEAEVQERMRRVNASTAKDNADIPSSADVLGEQEDADVIF